MGHVLVFSYSIILLPMSLSSSKASNVSLKKKLSQLGQYWKTISGATLGLKKQ